MSTRSAWLMVKTDGLEHVIDRTQIVEITFHTAAAQMRTDRGGQRQARTAGELARPDYPEQFVAQIYTTLPGHVVKVSGDEARRLYEQVRPKGA